MTAALAAAVTDVRTRRIPNKITGPLLLGGLLWAVCTAGTSGLGASMLGMVIVGLPFFLLWLIGGGGAGDAKLMLAIGAWLGPRHGVPAVLAVALVGGLLSLGYALWRREAKSALLGTGLTMFSLPLVIFAPARAGQLPKAGPSARKVPYGVAILGGVCAAATWVHICGA
jgi:prepilin peptidase CpaA